MKRFAAFSLIMMMIPIGASAHCDEDKHAGSHPHCAPPDDPPTPSATYDVVLAGRVFNFGPPGVTFTPDGDGGPLFPDAELDLVFSRPTGEDACDSDGTSDAEEAACAWDAVFAACENFFGSDPIVGPSGKIVSQFTVPAGNWQIDKAGGVRLIMIGIEFDESGNSPPQTGLRFRVNLQLIGNTFFPSPHAPWLPSPSSGYPMVNSSITGRTVKGTGSRAGCVTKGKAPQVPIDPEADPGVVHALTIDEI